MRTSSVIALAGAVVVVLAPAYAFGQGPVLPDETSFALTTPRFAVGFNQSPSAPAIAAQPHRFFDTLNIALTGMESAKNPPM